jgi:hypothetical protein
LCKVYGQVLAPVLIPAYQLLHHSEVVGQQRSLEMVEGHRRGLVWREGLMVALYISVCTDDDDAVLVSKVHDLLCVGIVGCSVGVCSHPFDQVVVPGGYLTYPLID